MDVQKTIEHIRDSVLTDRAEIQFRTKGGHVITCGIGDFSLQSDYGRVRIEIVNTKYYMCCVSIGAIEMITVVDM